MYSLEIRHEIPIAVNCVCVCVQSYQSNWLRILMNDEWKGPIINIIIVTRQTQRGLLRKIVHTSISMNEHKLRSQVSGPFVSVLATPTSLYIWTIRNGKQDDRHK